MQKNKISLFSFKLSESRIPVPEKQRKTIAIVAMISVLLASIFAIFTSIERGEFNLFYLTTIFITFLFLEYFCLKLAYPQIKDNLFKWLMRIFAPLFVIVFSYYFLQSIISFDSSNFETIKKSVLSLIYFGVLSGFFLYIAIKAWRDKKEY